MALTAPSYPYFLAITEDLKSTAEGKEMLEKCRKQDRKDP